MKTKKQTISILVLLFCLLSCNFDKHGLNRETLLYRYNSPEDSLKREAVTFLLENMTDQVSEIPDSGSISVPQNIPDSLVVNNQLLLNNIEKAFEIWNKYPWADSVPKDVFFNYLLPYKIYGERPDNWREYFFDKYRDSIRIYVKADSLHDANVLYYRILEQDIDKWFKYTGRPVSSVSHPGLNELLRTGSGNCYGWSYLNVMIMRSFGIPATIDIIPLWGRRNGNHSIEVFWSDEKQKFRTASGREIIFPAKIFRYSYKIQNSWTDSIKPIIKDKPFLLDFLKHNHWIDVTNEYTQTATIDYPCNTTTGFAYIFEKVPSGTLYQLWDIQEKKRLERIFTYENGKQVFW